MIPTKSFFLIFLTCLLSVFKSSACTGCVQLDEYTFDKLLLKFDATLVKFDVAFPYGEKHDIYASLAKDAKDVDNFLVAEVGVKDYGERDNEVIAQRYNVKKDNYPVIKLFIRGRTEPVTFTDRDGDFTTDNLRKFIKKNSGIHLSLPGCISSLDNLAFKFIDADPETKVLLVKEAEKIISDLKEKDKPTGKTYQLLMQRIIDKGTSFVESEKSRVIKLLSGKISVDKKKDLTNKINILMSFSSATQSIKDEF